MGGTVSQSGVQSSSDFIFTGNVYTTNSQASSSQSFEFDVTDQEETVTLKVPIFDLSATIAPAPAWAYELFHRTNSQPFTWDYYFFPGTNVFALPVGQYRMRVFAACSVSGGNNSASCTFADTISFSNMQIKGGALQTTPLVPGTPGYFQRAEPRRWFDPPAVSEFSFQMTTNSLFTGIPNFPTGFSNSFEVVAEGSSLGNFTTNDSVNFVELLGHGVPSFHVRNITPLVDGSSPTAFPIMLDFDTEVADFVMIPNPGVIPLRQANGSLDVYFAGVLESSTNLLSWTEVPGTPTSPFTVTNFNTDPRLFFRARQN